jgi:hypothetical protein
LIVSIRRLITSFRAQASLANGKAAPRCALLET